MLEFINTPEAIKNIFIILCIYVTNFKITNMKINKNINMLYKSIFVFLIALLFGIIKYRINYLTSLICSIFMISIVFSKNNLINGILTTINSFAINYVISFMTIIISFFINKIIKIDNGFINLGIIISLHLLLIYRVFKIRKIKKGLIFLQKYYENEYMNMIILNVCLIVLLVIITTVNANKGVVKDLMLVLITSIIIMFITIQKSLQLYYKQKLLAQELENTKKELEEKTKEIENLEAENIAISKKAHTLDHKQKSLSKKIDEMMLNTEISKEEVAEVKERLNKIGKDLYKEKTAVELSQTGITEIDDMLSYMQTECEKNKIDFELQIKGNIYCMTNNLISIEDLETLLADHIKNAIIAINHTDNVNRSILVRLGEIDGIYSLYIYDSGIEFAKETLENLGKKPSTTHADEGGTGMGFMNTFDALRKCKASLIIEEIGEPTKDDYTKAIIIKFDNKNEFKINTYR